MPKPGPSRSSRPDWSRKLPQPLVISRPWGLTTLTTLADVCKLIGQLPAETRQKSIWQHVTAELTAAADGADTIHVAVLLQMVLSMEGVECRPK